MPAHYFIAIPLSKSIQNLFSTWQDELKEKVSYKQWPNKQDLHITVKFLGPVADNKLMELKKELHKIESLQAFLINVGSIGTFGNPTKPRVLWAGADITKPLSNLHVKIEEYTENIGFQKENRTYRPHITLAKKWGEDSSFVSMEEIKRTYTEVRSMNVTEIVLYQIHPKQSPKYEVIEKYMLQRDE